MGALWGLFRHTPNFPVALSRVLSGRSEQVGPTPDSKLRIARKGQPGLLEDQEPNVVLRIATGHTCRLVHLVFLDFNGHRRTRLVATAALTVRNPYRVLAQGSVQIECTEYIGE